MNSQLISNSKSVLIENENKNISDKSGPKSYGSINVTTYETNISDDNNNSNNGWFSKATNGVYNVGSSAVSYGFGGLKWALSSTASVGTSVLSAGAEGIVQLKRKTSKDKNE